MSARQFMAVNGAMPTTTVGTGITTGTAIKTLQQIATPSTKAITVMEWGISFDGGASGTNIKVELVETDVAATVTAYVASGISRLNVPEGEASVVTLGTGASGYTASAEGSTTATRVFDSQYIPTNGQWVKQWPLGREPTVAVSKFLRVRVLAPVAVLATCYIIWEE